MTDEHIGEAETPAGYAGEMPGTARGFTMVVFDGATVPVGTPVFIAPQSIRTAQSGEAEFHDAAVKLVCDMLNAWMQGIQYMDVPLGLQCRVNALLTSPKPAAPSPGCAAESPKETMERLTRTFNQMSELERAVIGGFIAHAAPQQAPPDQALTEPEESEPRLVGYSECRCILSQYCDGTCRPIFERAIP